MKKFLFGILTLVGIGFSFCSATEYEITFFGNTFNVVNGYDNSQFDFSFNADFFFIENSYTYNKSPITLSLSGFDSDVILDSICFGSNGPYFDCHTDRYFDSTSISPSSCDVDSPNSLGTCYSGLNINLKDFGYTLTGLGIFYDSSVRYSFLKSNSSMSYNSPGVSLTFKGLFNSNQELIFPLGNCMGNGFCIPSYVKFIVPDNPKFKVNYGSTSYEYELDSDLSIYLKSPIVQSGNTFIYAGSTGINLFYNGSSQFYNKDKLYLSSMYWYNNNIFTPICL